MHADFSTPRRGGSVEMTSLIMSSKIIIIATVILLITSFSVLFVIEAKNHDYDYNKAWSVAYFENPRDNSLDFAIENHEGSKSEYGYKVFIGVDFDFFVDHLVVADKYFISIFGF